VLAGRSWAAVSARAEPRPTRDVDVAVVVAGDREAEEIVVHLRHRGYVLDMSVEHSDRDRLATVRLLRSGTGDVYSDLLFASSGIEREVVAEAEMLEVMGGEFVPVARTGHLLALKVLALRPDTALQRRQDHLDIRELLRVADDGELRRCRQALELIDRRGYDRSKDLNAEFERLLSEYRAAQQERRR
jgi:hypothetical protein